MTENQAPRILIVEDDADQSMLVCEALAIHYSDDSGENIVAVASAGECLQQDLAKFDIILQDYHLPDMSGQDLLIAIRERADVPVIFVTGENDSGTAAEAIKKGAQDYVVKLGDYIFALPVVIDKNINQYRVRQDNARLHRELQSMLSELRVKNIQLEESLQKLEEMAATDPVTGLANRRRFNELLQRYFSEAMRYGFDLTCCMCDLDHYKEFNDTFGHQVGDQILVRTAEIIQSSLRSSDVGGRYGGDEFVLLLPHTSVDRALAVGNRIREELIIEAEKYGHMEHMLRLSVGIASLSTDDPDSGDALVAMADRALYMAKERGKNQIVVHAEASHQLPVSS